MVNIRQLIHLASAYPRRTAAAAACLGIAVFTASSLLIAGALTPTYTLIDVGTIGYLNSERNQPSRQLFRVNDAGMIAGTSMRNSGQQAVYAEWSNGQYAGLTPLPVSVDGTGTPIATSAANAINASGDIVGWEEQGGGRYATLWMRDASGRWDMTHLQMLAPYTASEAWGINDRQEVVGCLVRDGVKYAAYWSEPTAEPEVLRVQDQALINARPEPLTGLALAINSEGVIVGTSGSDTFIKRPTDRVVSRQRVTGGNAYLPYLNAAGINSSGEVAVNAVAPVNRGEISSYMTDTPWTWSVEQGVQELLPNADASAWTSAINDAHYVLGYKAEVPGIAPQGFSYRSPFLYHLVEVAAGQREWQPFDFRNQLSALPDGWEFYKATALSNNGRIAVMAKVYDDWHLYILNPATADLSVNISPMQPTLWSSDAAARAQLSSLVPAQAAISTQSTAAIRVHNSGPIDAQNIVVTGTFDTLVTVETIESSVVRARDASTNSYCVTGGDKKGRSSINCHFGQLAVDDFADIVIKFNAAEPGDFHLTADISSTTSDALNPENNHQTADFQVVGFKPARNTALNAENVPMSLQSANTDSPPEIIEPWIPSAQPSEPPPLTLEGAGAKGAGGQGTGSSAGGCSMSKNGDADWTLPLLLLGLILASRRRNIR